MNSFSAGCTNRSSHREGFTPVSHWSNSRSFASSHRGFTRCTSFASSSKQKRKKQVRIPVSPEVPEFCGDYFARSRCLVHVTRTGEIVSTKFWHFWRHWYPHL